MNTTVLPVRQEIADFDAEKVIEKNVLTYAAKNLGYTHPGKQQKRAQSELAEAIRQSGLKPFTTESVRDYKEVAKTGGKFVNIAERIDRIANKMPYIFTWLAALAIVAVIGMIVGFCMFLCGSMFATAVTISSCIALTFFGPLPMVILIFFYCWNNRKREWRLISLSNYTGPVPEFALATAQEIHMRAPETDFLIDEFVVEKRVVDPFLIAKCKKSGIEFYLEVWSEPGYKQQRKA